MSYSSVTQHNGALRFVLVAAMLLPIACAGVTADWQEIDLSDASVLSDRGDWGHHRMAQGLQPGVIIDGDETTAWNSDGVYPGIDLAVLPANLIIHLPRPTVVGRLEMLTSADETRRVRDFEVHAQVDEGWALMGELRGNDQERIALDLDPASVQTLRIRLRGSTRRGNGWARIHTVRLFSPGADHAATALAAAELPDETRAERLFLREAQGLRAPEPAISYDAEVGYLGYVTSFLDTMIEYGTDRYGEVHSPQFVSLLEIDGYQHPGGFLPSIPGQRWWDRALYGGNLAHDLPLLEAMDYVTELTGDAKYREAAHAYLQFFLDNCTDSPTGLWPWGEHVYWDFYRDRPRQDNLNHETFNTPISFWQMAWQINPNAVRGQADGLINHVKDLESFAFCRHADITRVLPDPRPPELLNWLLDFQGVGGRLIQLWAFAWSKTGDEKYYGWIERMTDYFEECRLDQSGMLPVLSQHAYRPSLQPSPGATLTVGLLMLEASELMVGSEAGARLELLGTELLEVVAQGDPPPMGLQVVERGVASGGRAVSFWEDRGGWLDLRLDLPQAGEYSMTLRYALAADDTRRVVLIEGEEVGEFDLPGTGGWSAFVTVTAPLEPMELPAGEVVLRLLNRDSNGLCLDWLELHAPGGEPRLRVEAEDYLAMGVELIEPKDPEPLVVGFDSGYGGVSILTRQITDRPVTGFVGNSTEMRAYRVTGDRRHLEAARRIAAAYAEIEEVPQYEHLRASVFGSLLHMMLDMNEFDPDERWLEAAERFARAGIEGLYRDGLFRGATGQWYYDSHLGVSALVHGLVRLHAVLERDEVQVPSPNR